MDFDYGLLAEMEEATAGSTLNYVNYGDTWIDNVQLVNNSWGDAGHYVKVKVEYTGQILKFDPKKQHIEFQIHQEIEKRDGGTFIKTWYVDKRKSGKRAQDKKDWHEIIRPSVEKVFGSEAAFFKAMSKRVRCAIEDFVTGKVNKNGYDVTAPKFLATFKNKAEEDKDRAQRFPNSNGSQSEGIPQAIVNQAKAVIDGENPDEALALLQENFSEYDANELYKLANA